MKKQLQAQIKKLAEQILSESDKKDTSKMKKMAQSLYEKLAVLEYLEIQIFGTDEDDSMGESLDSKSYRENNWFKEPEPVPQPEVQEEIVEPVMEKIKDLVAQMPEESQSVDALLEEVLPPRQLEKNDLEEFASEYKDLPVFERKIESVTQAVTEQKVEVELSPQVEPHEPTMVEKPRSLNDALTNGLQIGLNDRLAFIKHLFDGKSEDYTRVISQINSCDTLEQAETFIKGKVKPDYNYWLQKEEYAKRFMKIVKNRFS